MSKKNCWIDEFHIKVDWLRGLARNNQPFELPSGFPKFEDRQGFAKALGISKSDLANWCPDPKKKPKDPPPPANRPRVHFVRNVARVFGFAPPGGTDDDEVWRNWWAKRWRSFTPSETNRNETSPASVFEACYREALAKGTLVFLSPVLPKPITGPDPQPVTPPRPTFEQVREIAALIEQFKAELASDPRHDNKQGFILDQLDGIEIPPDPSIAIETYLLRLRIVQKALLETFHDAGSATDDETISFGKLVQLVRALSELLGRLQKSRIPGVYAVIVSDELWPYFEAIRTAIRNLPLAELPFIARYAVQNLEKYLDLVAQRLDRRVEFDDLSDLADDIRQHRIGALHGIERHIAILIGKRAEFAPNFAIFRDEHDGNAGPELVIIPAGTFLMGSAEDEANLKDDDSAWNDEIVTGQGKRPMRIARRFALGRFPVTFEEYDAFLTATAGQRARATGEAGDNKWGRGRRPVINVSWHDARDYCAWLNRMFGLQADFGYRLPAESEWEYGCRAGTNTRRWWGDDWDPAKANGNDSFEGGRTSPVGYYAANPWGLYDMIGNVEEWCADHYCDNISMLPADGTAYEGAQDSTSSSRVLRGGCWYDNPWVLRSAVRYWVCAVTRRRFPVGASPTRRALQPEAAGAAMEVTK